MKFKQTEIGEIPEDWNIKQLSDPEVSSINMGQSPPSQYYNERGEGLPFYQGNADFGYMHPKPRLHCNIPKKIANQNDILISVRAPVGAVNIATEKCCIGRGVAAVTPKDGDPRYLYYYLQSIASGWIIEQTTFEAIKSSYLKEKLVPWPKQPERSRITSTLFCIDSAISQTDELVTQVRQLKKGVMQQLLTRGIGHTRFKKTDIGEMPVEWDVKSIEELCENLDYMRKPITKSDRVPGEVPYYGATGIQDHVEGYLFDEDLVLVAEDCGEYGSFGQTAYTISGKAWVNNHAHILRCKGINWIFLTEYLNFTNINHLINTGNRGKLNKSILDKLRVPVPKNNEDVQIAKILFSVDAKISSELEKRAQLELLKKGLMRDLLTGMVRFPEFRGASA